MVRGLLSIGWAFTTGVPLALVWLWAYLSASEVPAPYVEGVIYTGLISLLNGLVVFAIAAWVADRGRSDTEGE